MIQQFCRIIYFHYNVNNFRIIPACSVSIDKLKKIFISGRIVFFKHIIHDIIFKELDFAIIRSTKSRVNINIREIISHNIKTEAVNSCYLCIMYK